MNHRWRHLALAAVAAPLVLFAAACATTGGGRAAAPAEPGAAPVPVTLDRPPSLTIEVIVTDKKGLPAQDLRVTDFDVVVDGRRRPGLALGRLFRGPGAEFAAASRGPGGPGEVLPLSEPSRVIVVVVDQASFSPGDELGARAVAEASVGLLGLSDRVAVVTLPALQRTATILVRAGGRVEATCRTACDVGARAGSGGRGNGPGPARCRRGGRVAGSRIGPPTRGSGPREPRRGGRRTGAPWRPGAGRRDDRPGRAEDARERRADIAPAGGARARRRTWRQDDPVPVVGARGRRPVPGDGRRHRGCRPFPHPHRLGPGPVEFGPSRPRLQRSPHARTGHRGAVVERRRQAAAGGGTAGERAVVLLPADARADAGRRRPGAARGLGVAAPAHGCFPPGTAPGGGVEDPARPDGRRAVAPRAGGSCPRRAAARTASAEQDRRVPLVAVSRLVDVPARPFRGPRARARVSVRVRLRPGAVVHRVRGDLHARGARRRARRAPGRWRPRATGPSSRTTCS